MITLFASIAGFISSIFPEILKIIKDRNDKIHELNIFDRQIAINQSNQNNRLEEINTYADISSSKALYSTYKTGINWVDALNGSVRPVLAYAFFILYSVTKLMQYKMIANDAPLYIYLDILWTVDDQAIFAGIISFYYGQRALSKNKYNK